MRRALLVSTCVLVWGCGNVAPNEGEGIVQTGLRYQGSIAIDSSDQQQLELSAPLFPDSTVFERFQDASIYATLTEAERLALIDDDVRTFEELLPLCAATHPAIHLQTPGGPPLTPAQIVTNYDEVARCAYQDYGAKPYWVPQHVHDVDICGRKLGAEWRLPTEADIATLQESDFQFFQDTLTAQPGADSFPTHFYYSLDMYLRGGDGTLAFGDLAPGANHVTPLPISGDEWTTLYLGNGRPIGLRCWRVGMSAMP
jgi:hypothetical protein